MEENIKKEMQLTSSHFTKEFRYSKINSSHKNRMLINKEVYSTKKEFQQDFSNFMKPRMSMKNSLKMDSMQSLSPLQQKISVNQEQQEKFVPFVQERDRVGRMLINSNQINSQYTNIMQNQSQNKQNLYLYDSLPQKKKRQQFMYQSCDGGRSRSQLLMNDSGSNLGKDLSQQYRELVSIIKEEKDSGFRLRLVPRNRLVKEPRDKREKISLSPSPGYYDWDKSLMKISKSRLSLVDLEKSPQKHFRELYDPNQDKDLPYWNKLGVNINFDQYKMKSEAYSKLGFDKDVARDKVSFLKETGKLLYEKERIKEIQNLERATQKVKMMQAQEEAKRTDFNLMKQKPKDNKPSENKLRPLVGQLNYTMKRGRQVKGQIMGFLDDTYNLTEVFLRKQQNKLQAQKEREKLKIKGQK